MVLSEAIRDYGECLRHELGHSQSTVSCYRSWQRNFARWLEEHGLPDPPVREITGSLDRRYVYHLSGRGLPPRTIRGAVRALFAYLVELQAIPADPMQEVKRPSGRLPTSAVSGIEPCTPS
jgi:site-specific recombinase XerD